MTRERRRRGGDKKQEIDRWGDGLKSEKHAVD